MLKLNIQSETSQLQSVILGTAVQNGSIPKIKDCYDPKSIEHIVAGAYPLEKDMIKEMAEVIEVFKKYGVQVYRPKVIAGYNQIFARDIGFVLEDKFIRANILPDRDKEIHAIDWILDFDQLKEQVEEYLEGKKSPKSLAKIFSKILSRPVKDIYQLFIKE